ncbi:hypothetical protein OU757_004676 [Yersinia enterocolitica]|nr:hypothetical protein [Yersinia enterocolitica]EKN3769559.1 hypothetical protein [Yersinia enterocolitica]ELY5225537.1 hypothetical protein [Yersinia enterocolitica]EMB6559263.1 hypothetical protein [Yersinia enterocolitica]
MKELDGFTVERLEEILNFDLPRHPAALEEIVALARIALAAKRADPCGYAHKNAIKFDLHDTCRLHEQAGDENFIALYTTPQLNSPEIPEDWISIPRDMLADYRDVKNAEVENYKAGFAGYYDQEGTRWARDFADLCEELAAIDKELAAAPEKPL